MTKTEARILFQGCLAELLTFLVGAGTPMLLYEYFRTESEQAAKVKAGLSKVRHSQHQEWLAVDFVLLADLNGDGRAAEAMWKHQFGDIYEQAGLFWEKLHPLCRWGGRFGRDEQLGRVGWDPGHFEISREYKQFES